MEPGFRFGHGGREMAIARGSLESVVKRNEWPKTVYEDSMESREHVKFHKGA